MSVEHETPPSSIRALSPQVFDAVASWESSESTNRNVTETSELYDFEMSHILDLIDRSGDTCLKIAAITASVDDAARAQDASKLFSSLVSLYVDGLRTGWHGRSAVIESRWLHDLHVR